MDKWVLEYSKEQKAFHIQTAKEREKYHVNGYNVVNYFNTQEEAENELNKILLSIN